MKFKKKSFFDIAQKILLETPYGVNLPLLVDTRVERVISYRTPKLDFKIHCKVKHACNFLAVTHHTLLKSFLISIFGIK